MSMSLVLQSGLWVSRSGLLRALRYRYAGQLRSSSPVAYPVPALGVHTSIDASVKHTRPCGWPHRPSVSSSCYPQSRLLSDPPALTGPFLPAGRCPRSGESSRALSFFSSRSWSSHRIPAQPILPEQLERERKIVAFIPYISTSDPDLSATAQALKVLDTCGSDIIELGIPHSDPLANEPVMEAAATQSLARGSNFDPITSMLKVVLLLSSPDALFSNFNPILMLGVEKLKSILNVAGVQGQRPPSVHDVFISYKQKDMQPQVSHLKSALELREIKTFVDFIVEEGVEFQAAIDKAIEQSEIAVVIVSRNFHSSPWCLEELVKILECRKKWGCIVLPIFWGMDAKELQEQPRHFVDKIDQAAKDFKQEKPRQVKRWRDALRALGRIKGWSVSSSSDKTEADVIKDLADKISAKLNRSV